MGKTKLRPPLETTYVAVIYQNGNLVTYHQGQAVQNSKRVSGDFSKWVGDFGLLLGDELPREGRRNWNGTIYALALFERFLSAGEVATRFRALTE